MRNKVPLVMIPLFTISCGISGEPMRKNVLENPEPEDFERFYYQDKEPVEGVRDNDIWLRDESIHKRVDGHWVRVKDFGGNNKFFLKGLLDEKSPKGVFEAAIRTLLLDNLTYSGSHTYCEAEHHEDEEDYFRFDSWGGHKEFGMRNKDRFLDAMQSYSSTTDPSEWSINYPANGSDVYYWKKDDGTYCRYANFPEPSPSPIITEEDFYYRMFRAPVRNHMPLRDPFLPYPLPGSWKENGTDYCFHAEIPNKPKYEIHLTLSDDGRYMTHFTCREEKLDVKETVYWEMYNLYSLWFFDFHQTPRIDIPSAVLDGFEALLSGAEGA